MSAKKILACAALVLLPCAALFVVNTGLKRPTSTRNAPAPLTAQQAGASETAGWLAKTARTAKGKGDHSDTAATLRKASKAVKNGSLKTRVEKSLEEFHKRSRE